ncbi:3-keto-5-aminohexanoate cleavage protein [Photobacterium sanctipauli]|uniref:3-keto-5-aminohexanoate cleavage protein n=1 Tax=Photobacterium sanctipauli TaxID=1342794 RepID=A0A2T3NWV3_9GAMM|nr:3-keto-5-aminohexanoate cleavage protein [Photobacterium sanctipauli]PSW20736.1 3-keto-5-aminohexanoate cleavage protein [Photobacterium sanctipauli]
MEENTQLGQTAIIVAPNGARKSRVDHPALPITQRQIINEVIACRDAGAAMVHLHARDHNGKHSLDIDDNIRLYQALKEQVGDSIIVQLTTEAIGQYSPEQQMTLIKEVKPEAASFALSELLPDASYLHQASEFFHWVASERIIAQYILYSPEDLKRYFHLLTQGKLPTNTHHLLLVLGRYQQQQTALPSDLAPFLQQQLFDHKQRWAVCAFGKYEHQCLATSMLMGGDIRVGFENNHLNHLGTLAKNNAEQVVQLKQTAAQLHLSILDADAFRQLLIT